MTNERGQLYTGQRNLRRKKKDKIYIGFSADKMKI